MQMRASLHTTAIKNEIICKTVVVGDLTLAHCDNLARGREQAQGVYMNHGQKTKTK